MSACPRCKELLVVAPSPWGVFYVCRTCRGKAVTLPVLRRLTRPERLSESWRSLQAGTRGDLCCPFCTRALLRATLGTPPVVLDACVPCQLVWFDDRELDSVAAQPGAMPPPDVEVLVNTWRCMIEGTGTDGAPGLRAFWPAAAWGLTAVVVLTGLLALVDARGAAQHLGLLPSAPFRLGGLTWITSSLVHGNVLHLAGEAGLLFLFGRRAEVGLGAGPFLVLFAGAELVGKIVHLVSGPVDTPCIGASGGVVALAAFFVLRFPEARVPLPLRIGGRTSFALPAWATLLYWLGFRALLLLVPPPAPDLSMLAQAASALVGVAFWFGFREPPVHPSP